MPSHLWRTISSGRIRDGRVPKTTLDVITHDLSDDWSEYAARQKYPEGWDTELTLEVNCPICGSTSPSQSYVPAKVLVEKEPLDRKLVVPEGFQCFVCGFLIAPTERYLAKHFVLIPEETATAFLQDIGID